MPYAREKSQTEKTRHGVIPCCLWLKAKSKGEEALGIPEVLGRDRRVRGKKGRMRNLSEVFCASMMQ